MAPFRATWRIVAIGTALMLAACGGGNDAGGNRTAADAALAKSDAAVANVQATRPTTMAGAFEKGFDDKFVPSFIESCSKGAASGGLPAAKIAEVCRCGAEGLVAKYSARELIAMSDEKAAPVLNECARKSGLSPR